jgi:hypothetical protein
MKSVHAAARITALRPDSTSAFSWRNVNYFACFFWIATTRINYFYLIAHNSKETDEIFRISPRKSARGIRPLEQCYLDSSRKETVSCRVTSTRSSNQIETASLGKIMLTQLIAMKILNSYRTAWKMLAALYQKIRSCQNRWNIYKRIFSKTATKDGVVTATTHSIFRFRSRTRTSKTTWKWRVVSMYGYATPKKL